MSELPYGRSTEDYKEFLCTLVGEGQLKRFTENHTTETVSFTLYPIADVAPRLPDPTDDDDDDVEETKTKRTTKATDKKNVNKKSKKPTIAPPLPITPTSNTPNQDPELNDIESLLTKYKLKSTISMANLVAFDSHGKLRRYVSAEEVLEEHYPVRLQGYVTRKEVRPLRHIYVAFVHIINSILHVL